MNFGALGKTLIFIGIGIAVFGGLMMLFSKVPFLSRLPGDIRIERENFTFYFPVTSWIIISIIITVILNLIFWLIIRK
jgi:uncharacterized protein HemY